jgi:CHAD domain-containing protein
VKGFEKFSHRQFKQLKKHLKNYARSGEPAAIHQIRVDIKKIKAILGVIEHSVKNFQSHKNFIPFRKIFRRAGEIREPDVYNQLLLQYKVNGAPKSSIKGEPENLSKTFESDIPNFIKVVKNQETKLQDSIRAVHRSDLKRYVRAKMKEVELQLTPKPQMKTIHKTRKAVKEVIYLSEAGSKLKKGEAIFYERMADLIGKFHDNIMLLDKLKTESDKVSRAREALIREACVADKKKIDRVVHNFYQ